MTEQAEEIRALVRDKYGAIARKETNCCGSSCGCDSAADGLDMIANTYQSVEGYQKRDGCRRQARALETLFFA
jgi:hypothetical protein